MAITLASCSGDGAGPLRPEQLTQAVPASMTMTPDTLVAAALGEILVLSVSVLDQHGEVIKDPPIQWSSGDSLVATVDTLGRVTPVGHGRTEVVARLGALKASASINVTGHERDRAALERLYRELGGEEWNRSANWLTQAPLSKWEGVTVDPDGHVARLRLSGNNLSGPLGEAVTHLEQLYHLDLSLNDITGSVPPGIGNLSELRDLILYDTRVSGPLPEEIGSLDKLVFFDVGLTELVGPIPESFANLKGLNDFYVHGTGLCVPVSMSLWLSRIPSTDGELCVPTTADREVLLEIYERNGGADWHRQLYWGSEYPINRWEGVTTDSAGFVIGIDLTANNLTGKLLPAVGDLEHLQELYLRNNDLVGPIPAEWAGMKELEVLGLSRNRLSGSMPPELGDLASLTHAYLYNNEFVGAIPARWGQLAELQTLNLAHNRVSGPLPDELGDLASLTRLFLHNNELTGTIPGELGRLSALRVLTADDNRLVGSLPKEVEGAQSLETISLRRNELEGAIPPELGNIETLKHLYLGQNALSGTIPATLGDIDSLEVVSVVYNEHMGGLIPRSLMKHERLQVVRTYGTGVCAQIDREFQEWMSLIEVTTDECDTSLIERLALLELYGRTAGASWRSGQAWGSDRPLGTWHGVTTSDERVRELKLANNGLEGPVPAEIANLTALRVLDLGRNQLAGALPSAFGSLSDLRELDVGQNTDLSGRLPFSLAGLASLEAFDFSGTALCGSPAPTFQGWISRLGSVSGATCGNAEKVVLSLPVVYLTQAVQRPSRSVPLVANREALLRVFLTADRSDAYYEPRVRATVINDGREAYRVTLSRHADQLETGVDERNLDKSYNAVIPPRYVQPRTRLVVEADIDSVVPRADGSVMRFPANGSEELDVVEVDPMELTVVPVLEAKKPDSSVFEWTDGMRGDSPHLDLLRLAFPFSEFAARSRKSFATSLDLTSSEGQWGLVLELELLRMTDAATGYYYGAARSANGPVRGRARLGGWASMGNTHSADLAHEIGHLLNLRHAPCGDPPGVNPEFPYPDGGIGGWGYDSRRRILVSPDRASDVMGYCYFSGQAWLSDYYFQEVLDFRESLKPDGMAMSGGVRGVTSDHLVLWGGVTGGDLRMEPPLRLPTAPILPSQGGPYRIEGLARGGGALFSIAFTPGEDAYGDKYFLFAIPIGEWQATLARIDLHGPEGTVAVDVQDDHPMSIVTADTPQGEIRAILRDWAGEGMPAVFSGERGLQITTTSNLADALRPSLRR